MGQAVVAPCLGPGARLVRSVRAALLRAAVGHRRKPAGARAAREPAALPRAAACQRLVARPAADGRARVARRAAAGHRRTPPFPRADKPTRVEPAAPVACPRTPPSPRADGQARVARRAAAGHRRTPACLRGDGPAEPPGLAERARVARPARGQQRANLRTKVWRTPLRHSSRPWALPGATTGAPRPKPPTATIPCSCRWFGEEAMSRAPSRRLAMPATRRCWASTNPTKPTSPT